MIVSLDVTALHYSQAHAYIARLPELHNVLEKCGATLLGCYFVDGGGHGEIVTLTKWEGIQARSEGFEKALNDMGLSKLHQELMQCVSHIDNFLCIPNPAVSMENWIPTRRLNLRMYKVKGSQAEAAKKYVDMAHYFKDKIGASSSLIALLHPVAFQGHVGLISITEEGPSGIDAGLQKSLKAAADPDHAQIMRKMSEDFEVLSSRFMTAYNEGKTQEFLAKKE